MTKIRNIAAAAAALALAASLPLLASCQSVKSFFGGEEVITYGGDQPENYPVLHAVGYGLINIQKGPTRDEKVLQAMNVSKLEAYKELTAQVYGVEIDGNSTVGRLTERSDELKTSVIGIIRGARVIRQYPVNSNMYATELELNTKTLYDLEGMRDSP